MLCALGGKEVKSYLADRHNLAKVMEYKQDTGIEQTYSIISSDGHRDQHVLEKVPFKEHFIFALMPTEKVHCVL